MTPEQITENVKRLREFMDERMAARNIDVEQFLTIETKSAMLFPDAIQTINALVQLVGEMHQRMRPYSSIIEKSSPIAALAKSVFSDLLHSSHE